MMRVVVMISGSGSNLQALVDAQHEGRLNAQIVGVICDQPRAYGVERATKAGIPTICVPLPKGATRHEWAQVISNILEVLHPDLIVMAGWMRIMPPSFVERWSPNLINQHPALLPETTSDTYITSNGCEIPAIRGAHAVRDALRLSVPVTGCTIHHVTAEVDVGPVLARAEVPILPDDSESSLHERIKQQEHRLIVQVINELSIE
ncbi:MAG: phosphoribosylglycinamide formyltransferase [Herpetosiphon sp.]|nr:phosphoribosylglycinamide formyltransferase [Herpetosiphon sp.]